MFHYFCLADLTFVQKTGNWELYTLMVLERLYVDWLLASPGGRWLSGRCCTGVYRPGPTDVVMAEVPLPLGLSRLFRNIPQRHNKVVTEFRHHRAGRPDPPQKRAQLSAES